jgi:thiamine pyrophosphate-dependent acetolactate synthase large subunit-like protein
VVVLGDAESSGPDPVGLAQSFGATAYRADDEGQFAEAMGRTLRTGGPALIAVTP